MSFASTAVRFGTRLTQTGGAVVIIGAINWLFNYPYTTTIIWIWGPWIGSAIVLASALVLNLTILWWYKRTTTDWFGLEWLRLQESVKATTWSGKFVRYFLKRSRFLAFVAISLAIDPTYGFIYYRGRGAGKNFNAKDWIWFALANLIGVLPWVIGASLAVTAAQMWLLDWLLPWVDEAFTLTENATTWLLG